MEQIATPLEFINKWDFILMSFGVVIRFLVTIQYKSIEFKEFSLKKYFDTKHTIRWGIHLMVSITAILAIPEVFIEVISPKYFPEILSWGLIGSVIIGFVGYDLIKVIEKLTAIFLKKAGVQSILDEKR